MIVAISETPLCEPGAKGLNYIDTSGLVVSPVRTSLKPASRTLSFPFRYLRLLNEFESHWIKLLLRASLGTQSVYFESIATFLPV